jgi:hypothetical protein
VKERKKKAKTTTKRIFSSSSAFNGAVGFLGAFEKIFGVG